MSEFIFLVIDTRVILEGRKRYFTNSEVKQLRDFFRDSKYPEMEHFIELGLSTGMRNAEILSINQTPDSLPKYMDTFGEVRTREGQTCIHLRETKNMKPRIIPLAPKAMKAFKALDKNPLKF